VTIWKQPHGLGLLRLLSKSQRAAPDLGMVERSARRQLPGSADLQNQRGCKTEPDDSQPDHNKPSHQHRLLIMADDAVETIDLDHFRVEQRLLGSVRSV